MAEPGYVEELSSAIQAESSTDNEPKTPGRHSDKWIRYCVEHRHRQTGELLSRKDLGDPGSVESPSTHSGPILEVVRTYRIIPSRHEGSGAAEQELLITPTVALKILSPAIINALRSVVEYYPGIDLSGEVIIQRPYCVLVHHYEEIKEYADARADKAPGDLCIREHDVVSHLRKLLEFLDNTVMSGVRAEMARNKDGSWTFEYAWVKMKPGRYLYDFYTSGKLYSGVIYSVAGGSLSQQAGDWIIRVWGLKYNGRQIGRKLRTLQLGKWDGAVPPATKIAEDKDLTEPKDKEIPQQLRYGESYWRLVQKQCMYHRGAAIKFPYNEIDGLVMVDLKGAIENNSKGEGPVLMGSEDWRHWITDCTCSVCKGAGTPTKRTLSSKFSDWDVGEPEDEPELAQLFLCPHRLNVYVFKTRSWEKVHVKNLSEPRYDESMIEHLVMDSRRKKSLMSLAKSFARVNKLAEVLPPDSWSADFVKGKGKGLIFLLHGKPGVGKTCTAECIAAFTKQPLMILTSSDIGTDPASVEKTLTKHFKIAKGWGAVLLIDEADVFMERRSVADLTRNSLVAGFLRALEFYDGILFLTTNRVGMFDDAFISRVHVQLYYPDFTDEERQRIWKTFIEKLAREKGSYIRLNIDAKEYIRGAEMKNLKWNGREIRNAFQTAVSLAEFDAEKDEDGRIQVTDEHLSAVVELSKDFKDYLGELHQGDEGKRARSKFERLDEYGQPRDG